MRRKRHHQILNLPNKYDWKLVFFTTIKIGMSLLPFVSCLKSTIINNVALFTNIEVKKIFPPLKHQRNPPWGNDLRHQHEYELVQRVISRFTEIYENTEQPESRSGRFSLGNWWVEFCRALPQKHLRSYDPYRKGSRSYISCFICPYNYYDWIYPLQPPVHELMFTKF